MSLTSETSIPLADECSASDVEVVYNQIED